jgi:hypothetical protein
MSNEEDGIVLYHDICRLIARLGMLPVPVLHAVGERLLREEARNSDDKLDQEAANLLASIVLSYAEEAQ